MKPPRVFSTLLTSLILCLFVAQFFARKSFAGSDLSVSGQFRSYPLSALARVDMGYGLELWGSKTKAPWYGFIRPGVVLANAATYSSAQVNLSIFPISFLGVRGGAEVASMSEDYLAYDCTSVRCQGKFNQQFGEVQLGLALGPVFALVRGRSEIHQQHPDQKGDFIEPATGMLAAQDGDRVETGVGVLGLEFSRGWRLAVVWAESEMEKIPGFSKTQLLTLAWQGKAWSAQVGAGRFESSLKQEGLTSVARIEWSIWPSLALF